MWRPINNYNPDYIQTYAQILLERADRIVWINTVMGVLPGFLVGASMSYRSYDGINWFLAIVGALIGGAIGYWIGTGRAFGVRLQAQLALCQLQTEVNTRNNQIVENSPQPSRPHSEYFPTESSNRNAQNTGNSGPKGSMVDRLKGSKL